MEFKAFKMDGLGNDFVIIDQRHDQFELTNDQVKKYVIEILLVVINLYL